MSKRIEKQKPNLKKNSCENVEKILLVNYYLQDTNIYIYHIYILHVLR